MSRCKSMVKGAQCLGNIGHDGKCESLSDMDLILARIRVLESQVASLQMAAPRGIPR